MRIVIDCERMKYPNTGLYTFDDEFSHAMKLAITDKDQIIPYINAEIGHFLGEDVSYIKHRPIDRLFPIYVKKLDIWHTTYQLSRYTGGDKNTKHVLTVHDLNFIYERQNAADIKKYIKKHQKLIDRADYIVAISEFTKKDVLTYLDVKGKPIVVIHNGCALATYKDFDSPRYSPRRPFIFSIGTIYPKKNFHVLPALLKGNDYELIIAGLMSDYAEKIREEARKHNVEDRLKILGPVSGEEKYWYLKNCMAFAFPSIAEGFGIPVLEAMTFGKPVFLSNLTSLPEIGGEQAYYFENFDVEYMQNVFEKSMQDFSTNKAKTELIKEHAAKFNWDECAKKYYAVYQSLIL